MRHGVATTYVYHQCRCSPCTAANARRSAARRQARFALRILVDGMWIAPLPTRRHGSANTYCNWGCRCQPCRQANSRASRDRYRRRTAATT